MFIGTADDNPLTSARRRLERAVLGATTIDLSAATAKMQGLEKATYGVYQSLKEVLAAKSAALKTVSAGKMVTEEISAAEEEKDEPQKMPEQGEKAAAVVPSEVLSVPETPVTVSSEALIAEPEVPIAEQEPPIAEPEAPIAEPEAPMAEPEAPMAESEAPMAEPEAPMADPGVPMTEPGVSMAEPEAPMTEPGVSMSGPEAPMAEPEAPMAEPEAPIAEPEAPIAEPEVSEFSAKTPEQPAEISELPAIEEWGDEGEEAAEGRAEDASADDKKINISSILNISPKEIDRHFERIKNITTAAVKRAEEQAAQIKRRVESADLANSPSVGKIRALAQKIKFFGKK